MIKKEKNSRMSNFNPLVYERTKDGEVMYDVFSRLLKERIVFLCGEINGEMAQTIVAMLLFLDSQDNKKEISLYINSAGGSVNDGLYTIYDCMNYIKSPIRTVCIGEAYSAASLILAAGTPGLRMAFPNSQIMIHEIQVGMEGSGSEIQEEAERVRVANNKLMNYLARYTGKTVDVIKEDCKSDKFFSAEEAKKYGLIDAIVKSEKELPELKRKTRAGRKAKKTVTAKKKVARH